MSDLNDLNAYILRLNYDFILRLSKYKNHSQLSTALFRFQIKNAAFVYFSNVGVYAFIDKVVAVKFFDSVWLLLI
jgi:hypothetical protein